MDVRPGRELHSIQAIGLDHVLVTENGDPIQMRLINTKTNAVEKEVDVKPGIRQRCIGSFGARA